MKIVFLKDYQVYKKGEEKNITDEIALFLIDKNIAYEKIDGLVTTCIVKPKFVNSQSKAFLKSPNL